jgi:hypothetical protein
MRRWPNWWGGLRREKGPDKYDRKTVRITLLDGHTYEVASAQALAAEAIVEELYAAMTKHMTTPSAVLHYRRGQLIVRVDQIALVSTYQESARWPAGVGGVGAG